MSVLHTIVMMNYMVLNLKKRFEDYETLGELFKHSKELILEQTLVEKIWEIIAAETNNSLKN